jgi:predicted RNase H-like nuclease (RuvC/YqgF family)
VEINELLTIITGILVAINSWQVILAAYKKLKPEVKKMEGEAESELQEATNLNLEGAKISGLILLDRINELKIDLAAEKQMRREGMEQAEIRRKEEITRLEADYNERFNKVEKARKEDVAYFRRRIKDLEREARDYRSWAAKLNKQIVDAKLIPVPFIPTMNESDESITAVRPELETGPLDAYGKDKKE